MAKASKKLKDDKKYRVELIELDSLIDNDHGLPAVIIQAEGYDEAVERAKEKTINMIKESKPIVQMV